MSEAAILIPSLDSLPAAAGASAPAANTAQQGGFAGVLSQQMQDGMDTAGPPAAQPVAALPAEETGDGSPQTGKPLPLSAADVAGDEVDAFLLDSLPLSAAADATQNLPPLPLTPVQGRMGQTPLSEAVSVEGADPLDAARLPLGSTLAGPAAAAKSSTSATASPIAPQLTATTNTVSAVVSAEEGIDVANSSPAAESRTAALAAQPFDWLAMRMAKAGGLDGRPANGQAAATQRTDSQTAASGGSQDILQMLGLRPAAGAAAMMAARADGETVLSSLSERLLGGERAAPMSLVPAGSDVASPSLFSTMAPASLTPSAAALPTVTVATPVGQGAWAQDIGQRVTWLANQEIREAQIQLNPRHLGPIEVRIAYGQEQQISVNFIAHHPQAREALDAMLPRLREMFDGQGLNLANASVSQESFTERRRDFAASAHGGRGYPGNDGSLDPDEVEGPPLVMKATGLFDAYA